MQLAETAVRNDGQLTPTDWANAVGATLSDAVGGQVQGAVPTALARLSANLLVAGALRHYDKDAAEDFFFNAVGNEVAQLIANPLAGAVKERLGTTETGLRYNAAKDAFVDAGSGAVYKDELGIFVDANDQPVDPLWLAEARAERAAERLAESQTPLVHLAAFSSQRQSRSELAKELGFPPDIFGEAVPPSPRAEEMANVLGELLAQAQREAEAGLPEGSFMVDDLGRPVEEPELESELNAMNTRVRTVLAEGKEASATDVELVQRFLADRGYNLGSVDAIFGPKTARAASEYLGSFRGEFNLGFDLRANSADVSDHSRDILRDIFKDAGITSATVSSTARDSADQARVMFNNLVGTGPKQGENEQRRLYRGPGNEVIDVFVEARDQNKTPTQIQDLMKAKIDDLGPTNVSKHASDPSVLNVFDIKPSSIVNPTAFERAATAAKADGRISNFLGPRQGDRAYHIEIRQPSDEDE